MGDYGDSYRDGSRGYAGGDHGGDSVTFEVAKDNVGLIIGRGGSRVRELQNESGAHIKISRDDPPMVQIFGTPDQCSAAKGLIEDLIANADNFGGRSGGGGGYRGGRGGGYQDGGYRGGRGGGYRNGGGGGYRDGGGYRGGGYRNDDDGYRRNAGSGGYRDGGYRGGGGYREGRGDGGYRY